MSEDPDQPSDDGGPPPLPALEADPELTAEGWERRSVTDPTRQPELVELYESLGLEVKAVALTPDKFGAACSACAKSACSSYTVIYTRPARPGS